MAEKVGGTDNVFVLGVKPDGPVIPGRTQEQVDEMLSTSLEIQKEQINDFLTDLEKYSRRPDIVNYASLMKHLQSECVVHLSALASAAIIQLADNKAEMQIMEEKIQDQEADLRYWSNR